MPILTFSFGLQYMDKAVLNSASVFGIIKDLVRHRSRGSHNNVRHIANDGGFRAYRRDSQQHETG